MRAVRSKNTTPEKIVRGLVRRMGYRYRMHLRSLPGSPDIVIESCHAAIFVHGCFWHAHRGCKKARAPKTRTEYWIPKLARNAARDSAARAKLRRAGWRVLTIWQCKLRNPEAAEKRLGRFLGRLSRLPK